MMLISPVSPMGKTSALRRRYRPVGDRPTRALAGPGSVVMEGLGKPVTNQVTTHPGGILHSRLSRDGRLVLNC